MKHAKKCMGLLLAATLVTQVVVPAGHADAGKAKKPVLSKKTVKVTEGKKQKVTVKNAKGYSITVKIKNKKIASISKKGKYAFIVKGKKAGKTKITCSLKKKNKKITLTCNVKVNKKADDGAKQTVQTTAVPNSNGAVSNTQTPLNAMTPTATPIPTVTPEPTVAPFPKPDEYSEVPYDFADESVNVEKGKIEEFTYKSKQTAKDHKVLVQLPAKYSNDKKYPVLYLFHGENDTESAWKDMLADRIMDNAIAFKAAKEMVVVMPNISGDKDEDVIKDFADVLKPEVESRYSVAKERHETAVAGYGLGGRIALNIGLTLPDLVAYTGAFAPVDGLLQENGQSGYISSADFRIKDIYKDRTFIMIQKGKSDEVAGEAPETYSNALKNNGSECLFLEMTGEHGNDLFKEGLYNFARRIFKRGTPDESIVNGFVTKVPGEVSRTPSEFGKIEVLEYDTETYDPGNSVPIHKWANVFLPHNYDPTKKYNILYLMHGGGENADTWIKGDKIYGDYTHNQNMINLLFQEGYCEPCIIVNPTFYRPEGAPEPANAFDLTNLFQYELRNDLIPAVESKYSTYAGYDVSIESLKASRMHRGFAGLSMGSNTTYQSAFFGNYDLFAWFGPYSGYFETANGNDVDADRLLKVIEDGEANGMPLGYIYCGNGSDDFALSGQQDLMQKALTRSDTLVPGRNYDFVLIPGGIHDMNQWHIHLYNTLKIFFTKE